jgi:hypothetical protein
VQESTEACGVPKLRTDTESEAIYRWNRILAPHKARLHPKALARSGRAKEAPLGACSRAGEKPRVAASVEVVGEVAESVLELDVPAVRALVVDDEDVEVLASRRFP